MKVSGSRSVGSTGAVSRGGRAGASDAVFTPDRAGDVKGAAPSAPAQAIAAIDAILALQGVPDAMTGRAKAIARADQMLDLLDDIRIGLLEGAIPRPVLNRLVHLVQTERDGFTDPRLSAVLDDIDLRAQVELAKLNQSF